MESKKRTATVAFGERDTDAKMRRVMLEVSNLLLCNLFIIVNKCFVMLIKGLIAPSINYLVILRILD